ncbi:TPA: polysaccharide pyruvyl transferase family protein [Photobacterium damselae]
MKKIGIFTQPLHHNYGGSLQAFALQHYLKSKGHDVLTIDFKSDKKPRFFGAKVIALNLIKKYIKKEEIKAIFPLSEKEINKICIHTDRFKDKNIALTKRIKNISDLKRLDEYKFDTYIVGSDQVWRPIYSPGISAFFLEFLGDNKKIKRISYAASFGTEHCNEYSNEQISKFKKLLNKFDAISVREDSGVRLCAEYFGVNAEHVIDPTLLLDKIDYIKLVDKDKVPLSKGTLMSYVLDRNPEKNNIINKVVDITSLKEFSVMPDDDGVYPPVTEWLKGFIDAEYVITDSFHGMVFSIIFNKQFIVVANKDRGLSRFTSLLRKLKIEDRLIENYNDITQELINNKINFNEVNELLFEEKQKAYAFIEKSLK